MFKYKVIFVAIAIVAPFIFTSNYHRELLVLTCIFALLGLSMDIIYGRMGQITFGHQVFFGVGAYASALLTLRLSAPIWVGFLAAIVLAGVLGLIVGYVCLRKLRAMGLAMVTFGLGTIVWLVARNWYDITGGLSGLRNIPKPHLFGIELSSEISYYYLALSILLVVMYFLSVSWSSRAGRACISLRENEALASSVGVSPIKYYTLWFAVSCSLAGLAGALYGHHLSVVSPTLFDFQYIVAMFIVLIVGGAGTLGGPVVGAIVYIWGSELLRFSEELRFVFFGAIVLIFIVFMPKGAYPALVSLLDRLTNFLKRRLLRGKVQW
ncbi:MAG: branched-chain amino acid ABC transporter permease [Dehalococcoidia bacterium]|nr:branched-chain amino acid ABC transporter permease [Dehalococcoidia bacterium]